MQRLIIVRHAKAAAREAGQTDADRPLTETGRRDAATLGKLLAAAGWIPDLALVSTATRTRETWDGLAAAFPAAQDEPRAELYDASVAMLATAVREAAGQAHPVTTLCLVGHNPGIGLYAAELARRARADDTARSMRGEFPTATAACFSLDDGRPRLEKVFAGAGHGAPP